jgi:GcrA cell cycle regulator
MSFIWTDERVEALKAMWAAGKSGSEIAEAFENQVSRSAIIGKVHRMKLPARMPPGAERSRKAMPASSISVPKKRPATLPRSTKVAARAAEKPAVIQDIPEPIELTKAEGARLVPFLEIRAGECRFVVEDTPALMCGAPVYVPGEAWCRFHRRIVYVPATRRNDELRRLNSAAVAATRAAPVAIASGW